jgi:DNA-binding MarR family transcriptional regulator
MHQLLFALKRAFRTSIHFCERRLLAAHALTPSRFDIVYLLQRNRNPGVPQIELRRELGIASSTLSEMLKGLEARGWIRRTRSEADRRTFIVWLTETGLGRADDAVDQMIRDRTAFRALRDMFGWRRRRRRLRDQAYKLIETVQTALGTIEAWFGPRVALLKYPWYRPEDVWDPDEYPEDCHHRRSARMATLTRSSVSARRLPSSRAPESIRSSSRLALSPAPP